MKDHHRNIFLFILFISIQFCNCRQYMRSEDTCSVASPIWEEFGFNEIRFPFRLSNQSESCGYQGFDLYRNGSLIMIKLPSTLQPLAVRDIDYNAQLLYVNNPDGCLFRTLPFLNLSASPFHLNLSASSFRYFTGTSPYYKLPGLHNWQPLPYYRPVKCSSKALGIDASYLIPVPDLCLSDLPIGQYYLVEDGFPSRKLSPSCEVLTEYKFTLDLHKQELVLGWDQPDCKGCDGICSLNRTTNETVCSFVDRQYYYGSDHQGSHARKVTIGLCVSIISAVTAAIIFLLIHKMQKERKKRQNIKIEKFLKEFKSIKPTRYSSFELKKMTENFKTKLGQGGYGTVFKGKLPNGVPMAVKVLDNPTVSGEVFTNEIGMIGQIHHVNIVRLFGFCVEGSTRALIYEFMPNESLDKRSTAFSWTKLHEITIKIARGIEYLHQGCDQRILHLDIKPQNILLDQEFNPKICDFGLSKLCSKERSVVSMTTVRGTIGYIAPEVFLGNNRKVSCKSDVYSFGMLLLEMIRRRMAKISGHGEGDQTIRQIYFPEWIYNQLKQGEVLGLVDDQSLEDAEIVKKLIVIALWCAQWRPVDRPSMKEIIQMMEGRLQSLTLPPNPFISHIGQNNMNYDNTVED